MIYVVYSQVQKSQYYNSEIDGFAPQVHMFALSATVTGKYTFLAPRATVTGKCTLLLEKLILL